MYILHSPTNQQPRYFDRLADACLLLVCLRKNKPDYHHYLCDADDYLLPSTVIKQGLSILKKESQDILDAIATY